MALEYARMITKTGSGAPTIPASATHDNGDWIATDIYEGELYIDKSGENPKLYTRVGSNIVLMATGAIVG